MNYLENLPPTVKIKFNEKEYEFDTLSYFIIKLKNAPYFQQETYCFRTISINREFLADFKFNKIKSVEICHVVKDENGSPFGFTDTLLTPIVEIEQNLTPDGESGNFYFEVRSI